MYSRRLLISAASLSLALAVAFFVRASDPENASKDSATIEKLVARIAELEKRIETLEKSQQLISTRVPVAIATQSLERPEGPVSPVLPGRPLPRGWQMREFNGQPYYLVPLKSAITD